MINEKNEIKIVYNNKNYVLCEYMYGVLSMNRNDPLCCVSEANNSFSIDYWKGCTYQCAYCHVQGIHEDLDENYKMYTYPRPRSKFSIEEIIDALIKHPYFKKDQSIISIATSSTEPFANSVVTESTLKIMEYFVNKGFKNPFWIVTKAGVPDGISNRLKKICENGNDVMISFCYAGNPPEIEPMQKNRFNNIETLKETGVTTSWYLRPLVKEWGANYDNLEKMFIEVSKKYKKYIDMIVPGGLRWTEGIEFGMHIQKGKKMPKLIKEFDKKTLSEDIEQNILYLSDKYFSGKPVYFNSSCAISHMLQRNNIALLNFFKSEICNKSRCMNPCKKKCFKNTFTNFEIEVINEALKREGITIKIIEINLNNGIVSTPKFDDFNYTMKQEIKKTIARAVMNME